MGQYTELVLAFELKKDTPDGIINTLKYMIDIDSVYHVSLLDNYFLDKATILKWMLHSCSYYFAYPASLSDIYYNDITKTYHVSVRCSLKNYENEIDLFLIWIIPHIESRNKNFLGYYMSEDVEEPTLIYMSDY